MTEPPPKMVISLGLPIHVPPVLTGKAKKKAKKAKKNTPIIVPVEFEKFTAPNATENKSVYRSFIVLIFTFCILYTILPHGSPTLPLPPSPPLPHPTHVCEVWSLVSVFM